MRWFLRTLGIAYAAIVCGSTAMQAQHRSPGFRTDAVQAIAISTWNMEAVGGGITWTQNATFYRFLTRGLLNLIAAVSAPQGSLLTALDLDACDVTNLGEGTASLYRMSVGGPTGLSIARGDPDGAPFSPSS